MNVTNQAVESFRIFDFTGYKMPIITIYKKPRDFPAHYVARLYDVERA